MDYKIDKDIDHGVCQMKTLYKLIESRIDDFKLTPYKSKNLLKSLDNLDANDALNVYMLILMYSKKHNSKSNLSAYGMKFSNDSSSVDFEYKKIPTDLKKMLYIYLKVKKCLEKV